MKRPHIIAVLSFPLLALLVACGKEATPTAKPGPASPAAQELKLAAQELWDIFSASTQTLDAAAALRGIFIADIRERCTIEQMQETLASGEAPFPNIEVGSVFLDSEDPARDLVFQETIDLDDERPVEGPCRHRRRDRQVDAPDVDDVGLDGPTGPDERGNGSGNVVKLAGGQRVQGGAKSGRLTAGGDHPHLVTAIDETVDDFPDVDGPGKRNGKVVEGEIEYLHGAVICFGARRPAPRSAR